MEDYSFKRCITVKHYAIVNVYNDRMFLATMLESIVDYVDYIVFADGAYQDYYDNIVKYDPAVKPWSTDGTLEIIEAFNGLPPHKILHCPNHKPWVNQNEKRNALLDAVPNGDWFTIMDADVMLQGDIAEGYEEYYDSGCVQGSCPYYHLGLDVSRFKMFWHPRAFLKMEGMHYKGTHWQLRDRFNRIMPERYPTKHTDKFVRVHFKYFKVPSKLIPHQDYMYQHSEKGWLENV